ncbi:MAG: NlpC/P60 family protein [Nitrosomonas sp.]|nr:MAG: NlpC/P60 family protein [Nitrosomonas sp.]
MSGRHRKPEPAGRLTPIVVAGIILAGFWLALSAGHGAAAVATTALNVGVAQQEPPTSSLRRATRASYRPPAPPPPPIPLWQKAIQVALSKKGTLYVWGAKGPNNFDCSGLTQFAWKQAGITLGPDTYAQFQQGVPVAPSDVQPGDLLFPSASMNSRGPGHVQLAIGNGMVIEAPGRGMTVRIVPMPTSFVARRVA